MENYETYRSFEEGIQHFEHLFHTQPQYIACDLHPDYLATRYAETRAEKENLPLFHIQHHHAHLAACLADNQWNSPEPVIGLSFDGTGLGTDGTIWGGEFLVGGYKTCQRAYHLLNTPLPGGDTSIRKPSRIALAHLWQANMDWDSDLPPLLALSNEERAALRSQLDHHLNSPLTSSMGRLFDAASALIGVCQHSTYEGQPAIELEALVDPSEKGYYDFDICEDAIDPAPLWRALIQDLRKGVSLPVLAARFHNSIIHLSVEICTSLRRSTGCIHIALSGGVWQNKVLLTGATQQLPNAGFKVLIHHQVSANDGCIALGQALIAAYQIKE
jgi:hydrogenase maturation protein HypF